MQMPRYQTRREKLFLILMLGFGLFMLLITGLCIAKPQDNLIPGRIILYTLFWLSALVIVRRFWLWIDKRLADPEKEKISRRFILSVVMIFGLMLCGIGCFSRFKVYTDYGNIWDAALCMASGTHITNWEYFSTCPNNRFCMLLLAGMLWLGQRLGSVDGYETAVVIQTIHWCITLFCVYYLAKSIGNNPFADSWTAVTVFLLITPLYGSISIFYTDQCSFGYGIIAFSLWKWLEQKGARPYLFLLPGILWGIGIQIKVTVGISMIAFSIISLIVKRQEANWKQVAASILAMALTVGAVSAGMKLLPCESEIPLRSDPVLYWVALGLEGSGNYADNMEFAAVCRQAANKEERQKIVLEKLKSDWRMFFDTRHLVKKVRMNFASGDLGIAKYLDSPYSVDNPIWQFMSYNGPYFWKFACISTSYMFALYSLAAIGALRIFFRREINMTAAVSFLTLFGLVLFLMLWEAQHKQLLNHMGWMVLAASYGLGEMRADKMRLKK